MSHNVKFKKSLVGKPEPTDVPRNGIEMSEWLLANGLCPEWSRSSRGWGGGLCRRPIKDHERGLCGPHAGAVKRRENADKERADQRRRSKDNVTKAERLCKALGRAVKGGSFEPHYRIDHRGALRWTGDVVISADTAEALLDLLKDKGA